MMKKYDQLMEDLAFRADFQEDTLKKARSHKKTPTKTCRWSTIAACICLCTVLLFGTALAVSPTLRAILIPNTVVETTESPMVPQEPNIQLEATMDGITARYYKLDGTSAAHEGFGSAYPVEKNGVLSFYTLAEDGQFRKAKTPRHIQTDITYKGKTWSVDLELYDGDIPTIREGVLKYPINGNHITLGRWEGKLWLPIYVDLTTFAIDDPAQKLSFVPEEDALETHVLGAPGSSTLLIRSELPEDLVRCYYGNRETGQVTLLGEGTSNQWTLHNGKIYFYDGQCISQVTEDGTLLPLFGGKACSYDHDGFAYRYEGSDMYVIDLRNQEEYLLADCANTFSNPIFNHNRAGTKLSIANAELKGYGLYNTVIAIVDRETGTMTTLNRNPAMQEEIMGWFDHDHFLIGGTIDGQWYISLYEIS